MYCACMSVAKPGYSSVIMSEADQFFGGPHAHGGLVDDVDAHAGLLHLGDHRAEMFRVHNS